VARRHARNSDLEAPNVIKIETITGQVARWRLAGQRLRTDADEPFPQASVPVENADLEELRRDLANDGKPKRHEKVLRCRKGHALVWLIRTKRGIAPVASGADSADFGMRMLGGELMTLDQWPAGEHLLAGPLGSGRQC